MLSARDVYGINLDVNLTEAFVDGWRLPDDEPVMIDESVAHDRYVWLSIGTEERIPFDP